MSRNSVYAIVNGTISRRTASDTPGSVKPKAAFVTDKVYGLNSLLTLERLPSKHEVFD